MENLRHLKNLLCVLLTSALGVSHSQSTSYKTKIAVIYEDNKPSIVIANGNQQFKKISFEQHDHIIVSPDSQIAVAHHKQPSSLGDAAAYQTASFYNINGEITKQVSMNWGCTFYPANNGNYISIQLRQEIPMEYSITGFKKNGIKVYYDTLIYSMTNEFSWTKDSKYFVFGGYTVSGKSRGEKTLYHAIIFNENAEVISNVVLPDMEHVIKYYNYDELTGDIKLLYNIDGVTPNTLRKKTVVINGVTRKIERSVEGWEN